MQAEYARIPFAHVALLKLPEEVTDDQAVLTSDIFPTGYFAADLANIHPGCTVAVFGCGPVGQFVIASCKLLGAGRVIAVDTITTRLEMAQHQGAEIINFSSEDPVEAIRELTDGIGVDRAVDAVGVDANRPTKGPAQDREKDKEFDWEVQKIAPQRNRIVAAGIPARAPGRRCSGLWMRLPKAGTLSVIGVYPDTAQTFPIGRTMNKNLSVRMGNCKHRKYIPKLVDMIRTGVCNPSSVLTNLEPLTSAIEAYNYSIGGNQSRAPSGRVIKRAGLR